jgi:GT2 family glycosyltransferase
MSDPLVSVIISNKNGRQWLPKCFASLRQQTILDQLEVVMADNRSTDGSPELARQELAGFPRAKVIINEKDSGIAGGQNAGAAVASGRLLFFLNNDTWLEPDCLEQLIREFKAQGAATASPLGMDYDDNTFQSIGSSGIDLFGLPTGRPAEGVSECFTVTGCGFLVDAEIFHRVGEFDPEYFLNCEETDLSMRIWLAGGKSIAVPASRLHHRGAAGVNPAGQTKVVESRTSDTKRYLSNRNWILSLMKNCQHILLLLVVTHVAMLLAEAVVSLLLVRRWSYARKAYFSAIADAFRMMPHVFAWRQKIRSFRKHGDFWMLRFFRLRPGRLEEVRRLFTVGVPKVDER